MYSIKQELLWPYLVKPLSTPSIHSLQRLRKVLSADRSPLKIHFLGSLYFLSKSFVAGLAENDMIFHLEDDGGGLGGGGSSCGSSMGLTNAVFTNE